MLRIFLVALVTIAMAVPLAAQQEPGAGQETDPAGQQGMTQDTAAVTGPTERTSETTTRTPTPTTPTTPADTDTDTEMDDDMDDEGGTMPTTASPLPLVLVGGALLVAAGIGLRLARRS